MGAELITLANFRGMIPLKDDALIEENAAAYAENVDLVSGSIRPLKRDVSYHGIVLKVDDGVASGSPLLFASAIGRSGDLVILSRMFDHCAALTDISGATRMYLAGPDVDAKLIVKRAAGSAVAITNTNPTGSSTPGAPAVTITRVDAGATPTRYAVFAATYVYADGIEGPLSPYSEEFGYSPGDAYEFAPINAGAIIPVPVGVNFYITVPSASSDVPSVKLLASSNTYQYPTTGVLPNDILGEAYPEFDPLPLRLRTVAAAPWGGLAFTTNDEPGVVQFTDTTYLNRVYRENDINVGARVTCLLRGANVLFVLCDDGGPHVISGTSLGSHILTTSHKVEILVSGPRGASVTNNTCVFAAPRGLVMVTADANVSAVTEEKIFTAAQWQAMGPRDCALVFLSDGSIVFSMPNTRKTGIIKPYGLVWRSGKRRSAFARLPSDDSVVFV